MNSKNNEMAAMPKTDPTTVPAIAPPLIEFFVTGTAVTEVIPTRPDPEVELEATVVDVLDRSKGVGVGSTNEELVVARTVLL